MAILKVLSSSKSPLGIQQYLLQQQKTRPELVSGYDVEPDQFGEDFIETQKVTGKTEGRRYYHLIYSLSPEETAQITPEKIHELGVQFAEERFGKEGFEFAVVTHIDTDHIHDHIVVNAVNRRNGKKFHTTKKDLANMKEQLNELARERGISRIETNGRQFANGEYWTIRNKDEGRTNDPLKDPWKQELREVIDMVKKQAHSYDEMKKILKENWDISIVRDNGKGMTYIHQNGKKVRGKKLGTTYDKPALLEYFGQEQSPQVRQVPVRQKKILVRHHKTHISTHFRAAASRARKLGRKLMDDPAERNPQAVLTDDEKEREKEQREEAREQGWSR
ncbi:relaxase/mobilization nuclease domain-containing protein [Acidaminococcus fermentans]|uniref:relaxase/mobilization nuclease domain-containing protein n=1 Tax=Acidaminococcus fermentans TaxID=905 RepID=UPI00241E265B|nr:relaxase/mobilization nuclease domain-containing protein [Acidaminococcus fermentans]